MANFKVGVSLADIRQRVTSPNIWRDDALENGIKNVFAALLIFSHVGRMSND
ncbi:hypothetical protein D3C86_2091360 [compost metagenome]